MTQSANSLLTHLSQVQAALEATPAPASRDLSGLFLELDPVLMRLNKQRLEAKTNHQKLARQFGFDDAMAEAASDQLENTQRAYMERLAVLRARRAEGEKNRVSKQRLAQRREAAAQQKALARDNEHMAKVQAERKKRQDGFWFFVLMLAIINMMRTPVFAPSPKLQ